MPVTIPPADTLPTVDGEELHVPPGVASNSGIESPTHTAPGPVIGPGEVLTVIDFVAVQPPGAV